MFLCAGRVLVSLPVLPGVPTSVTLWPILGLCSLKSRSHLWIVTRDQSRSPKKKKKTARKTATRRSPRGRKTARSQKPDDDPYAEDDVEDDDVMLLDDSDKEAKDDDSVDDYGGPPMELCDSSTAETRADWRKKLHEVFTTIDVRWIPAEVEHTAKTMFGSPFRKDCQLPDNVTTIFFQHSLALRGFHDKYRWLRTIENACYVASTHPNAPRP